MSNAKLKDNQHVKPVIDEQAGTVTFMVKGMDSIVLHMDRLHPDIIKRAALVGMAQTRIVDAAAVGVTDDEGNVIPADERIALKHARMSALVEHYETGTAEWSRVSQGGGGAKSITIEAIARVKQCAYADAEAMVDRLAAVRFQSDRRAALSYLRESADVQKAIMDIRAERMPKAKVDADEILAQME